MVECDYRCTLHIENGVFALKSQVKTHLNFSFHSIAFQKRNDFRNFPGIPGFNEIQTGSAHGNAIPIRSLQYDGKK